MLKKTIITTFCICSAVTLVTPKQASAATVESGYYSRGYFPPIVEETVTSSSIEKAREQLTWKSETKLIQQFLPDLRNYYYALSTSDSKVASSGERRAIDKISATVKVYDKNGAFVEQNTDSQSYASHAGTQSANYYQAGKGFTAYGSHSYKSAGYTDSYHETSKFIK